MSTDAGPRRAIGGLNPGKVQAKGQGEDVRSGALLLRSVATAARDVPTDLGGTWHRSLLGGGDGIGILSAVLAPCPYRWLAQGGAV